MKSIKEYLEILANLKTDKAHRFGSNLKKQQAPHKPLLLLSVIDLFAKGIVEQNLIVPTDDLNKAFFLYWRKIMGDRKTSITYPFIHLGNEDGSFWHLKLLNKEKTIVTYREIGRSLTKLRGAVKGASLNDDLYELLQSSINRNLFREVLISTYFAKNVQLALIEQTFENHEKRHKVSRKESIIQRLLRDSKTSKDIKRLYDYTCQICRLKLVTGIGPYAEAAHIKPIGAPHNGPDIRENILCLCPNHHTLFDLGGLLINNDFSFIEVDGNLNGYLTKYSNHEINQEFIQYHRKLWSKN